MNFIPGQRLLTPEEVADWLAVPVATLYRWRYSGGGPPAVRVGKYLRFPADGVEAWLDEQVGARLPA